MERRPFCGPDPGYLRMNDPMNDNVLDILIYLFENFLESDTAPQPSRDVLREELEHCVRNAPSAASARRIVTLTMGDPSKSLL